MNILFICPPPIFGDGESYCSAISRELAALGHESAICLEQPSRRVGLSSASYPNVFENGITFADGRGPDIVHAWGTQPVARKVTARVCAKYASKYVVHLDEHDLLDIATLGNDDLRSSKTAARAFVAQGDGCTAFANPAAELRWSRLRCLFLWPGFDPEFSPHQSAADPDHQLEPDRPIVVGYYGDINQRNHDDVRSLFLAVHILNAAGRNVALVATGRQYGSYAWLSDAIRSNRLAHLGFLPASEAAMRLAKVDMLVIPGRGEEYRFPDKLPECLVSGKPVILPNANLGRLLRQGSEAVLLQQGSAAEIAHKIEFLIQNPQKAAAIGAAGRDFALRHLAWSKNVADLAKHYSSVLKPAKAPAARTDGSPSVPVKLIAFYLPQFHQVRENDEFWGEGFTEWTNVRGAEPQFDMHYQPQAPSDLGFYDLRMPSVLERQAQLASEFGIYGFCFYYYWFAGRRVLERPLEVMLQSGRPQFPFCVCWANENWTRNWDGASEEVLIAQKYDEGFGERFISDVIPLMQDRRYIRASGKPMLLVYRVDLLPDVFRLTRKWRQMCMRAGLGPIHLCAVQSFGIGDPREYGFDAAVEFPPHIKRSPLDRRTVPGLRADFEGYLEDYRAIVDYQIQLPPAKYPLFRGVMPAWDNTPRRRNKARIVVHSSPELYERWLSAMVKQSVETAQDAFVFINAWNEWAEGAYLEPDQRLGRARLEATRRALGSVESTNYDMPSTSATPKWDV